MNARDVGVTTCFLSAGMEANKSTDNLGRQRFHIYNPTRTVKGTVDGWVSEYSALINEPIHKGRDCCSANSITFHYMEGPEVEFVDNVILHQDEWKNITSQQRNKRWSNLKLGGYSEAPEANDMQTWRLLLEFLQPPLDRFVRKHAATVSPASPKS
mmetsp:Transcript_5813/g.9689  ORF Transcript_5813/g.9689 Transcript_5813/m.9689 type:complete len:156 (-) Transcript_5813:303-770(-)